MLADRRDTPSADRWSVARETFEGECVLHATYPFLLVNAGGGMYLSVAISSCGEANVCLFAGTPWLDEASREWILLNDLSDGRTRRLVRDSQQ